jgi:glycosyltransferase involved in cell wall biosynthesis
MTATRLRVCLVTLGDPGTLTGGYLFHLRLAELAPARDAEISFFSFPERSFPLPLLAGSRMLDAAASSDVVVVDSIAAWCAAPWLKKLSKPVVGMLHQPAGGTERRKTKAALDRRAYRHMDRIFVAGGSLKDDLSGEIDPALIVVVPPGRDMPPPAGDPPDLRDGRKIALLSVANWLPHKGTVELLKAFGGVPPGHATLHLVGRTDVDPRYAARVHALLIPLGDRVVVHGPLPKDRVTSMYAAADAFVLPSFVETYGTVYAEAMSAGLPVIGWDAGNLPHLADDGTSGLIVPTGDVDALAQALIRIAEDDVLRERLARGAEEKAKSFPTWEETADLFFSELRALL